MCPLDRTGLAGIEVEAEEESSDIPDDDGDNENLEEGGDRRWRRAVAGYYRRDHGASKWQERGHGADRQSAA